MTRSRPDAAPQPRPAADQSNPRPRPAPHARPAQPRCAGPAPAALAIASAVGGLGGCTVGPDYIEPTLQTAPQWSQPMEGGLSATPADLSRWWTTFSDQQLDSLVVRAVGANLDLRSAEARIRESRALRGIVVSDKLFTIDSNFSFSRQRASRNTNFGGIGASGTGTSFNQFVTGLDAAWEIDLWGRVERSINAADADLAADIEDRRDILLILLADVARAYVDLRTAQRRIEIAQDNVRIQEETLRLTSSRSKAGLIGELDVVQARSNVEATRATIPSLQIAQAQALNRLAVLLGQQPGSLNQELGPPGVIPGVPSAVSVGVPAELLRRRPDIRRAERQLAANTERIGVAVSDLFPRFTINGNVGVQAAQGPTFFDLSSFQFSYGPAINWRLIDFGRIRASIAAADSRAEASLYAYEQQVLVALEESENAIAAFAKEQQRRASLELSVSASKRAVELSGQLYAGGLRDFQFVLDAQRTLFVQQDQLVLSEQAVTSNLIALYLALGGGWEIGELPPPDKYSPTPPIVFPLSTTDEDIKPRGL
ncbi:MAG: RND transporter [Planctomyces sp.]|nr:RND transporter [Planctomyces sp.]